MANAKNEEQHLFLESLFIKNGESFVEFREKGSKSLKTKSIEDIFNSKTYNAFSKSDILKISSFCYTSKGKKAFALEGEVLDRNMALPPLMFLILVYASVFFTEALMAKLLGIHVFGVTWYRYAGGFVVPALFLISASITELYGYSISRIITWLMCPVAMFLAGFALVVKSLPVAPEALLWESSFDVLLQNFAFLIFSTVLIYLGADFLNSYIISKTKISNEGKYTYFRFILGSMSAALLKYFLSYFVMLFLLFGLSFKETLNEFLHALPYAFIFILFFSWPTVWLVEKTKRKFKADKFDFSVNYNPFHVKLK